MNLADLIISHLTSPAFRIKVITLDEKVMQKAQSLTEWIMEALTVDPFIYRNPGTYFH